MWYDEGILGGKLGYNTWHTTTNHDPSVWILVCMLIMALKELGHTTNHDFAWCDLDHSSQLLIVTHPD